MMDWLNGDIDCIWPAYALLDCRNTLLFLLPSPYQYSGCHAYVAYFRPYSDPSCFGPIVNVVLVSPSAGLII